MNNGEELAQDREMDGGASGCCGNGPKWPVEANKEGEEEVS